MASIKKNWVSGHNKYFDGMSEQMIRKLMGALPSKNSLPEKNIIPLENLPEQFDSRDYWPNC